MARILYGLDRLPRSLAHDDPRLPGVVTGPALRLNTERMPPAAWPDGADHATRWAALHTWLLAACGPYNAPARRFVDRYLTSVTAHVARHRDELDAALVRFDGLYAAQDWAWSALRPLPRAWVPSSGGHTPADIAFWDGTRVVPVALAGLPEGDLVEEVLPVSFRRFWDRITLPSGPFWRVTGGQSVISIT